MSNVTKGSLQSLRDCGSAKSPYENPSPQCDNVCSESKGDHDELWGKYNGDDEEREEKGLVEGTTVRDGMWGVTVGMPRITILIPVSKTPKVL